MKKSKPGSKTRRFRKFLCKVRLSHFTWFCVNKWKHSLSSDDSFNTSVFCYEVFVFSSDFLPYDVLNNIQCWNYNDAYWMMSSSVQVQVICEYYLVMSRVAKRIKMTSIIETFAICQDALRGEKGVIVVYHNDDFFTMHNKHHFVLLFNIVIT